MDDRVYEVRVTGLQPTQDLLDEFGDVDLAAHELVTVLSGRFQDQAAFYGFLNRIRGYGLEVIEVRRLPGTDKPADETDKPADEEGTADEGE